MFGIRKKEVPSNREFVMSELKHGGCSDEYLMDTFYYRYAKKWSPSSYAKRMETLRKELWSYCRKGDIQEYYRRDRKYSAEIYYKLK